MGTDPILDLIVVDEYRRLSERDDGGRRRGRQARKSTKVVDDRDFEAREKRLAIDPHGQDIPGPGVLQSLAVKVDSSKFHVGVAADSVIVNDTYSDLADDSVEMENVAAYEVSSGGTFVVEVSDVHFTESLFAEVRSTAGSSISFDRFRATVDLYEYV